MQKNQLPQALLKQVTQANGDILLKSSGEWTVDVLHDATVKLKKLIRKIQPVTVQWDISAVSHADSAGMMLFIHCSDILKLKGCTVELSGMDSEQKKLYQLLRAHVSDYNEPATSLYSHLPNPLYPIGKTTFDWLQEITAFLAFIGENFITLLYSLRHPASIRFAAIAENIQDAGVRALPIITVTSFLIGVVIAYQGAVQLEKFGANIFIVDMIGLSISRELAPLITAIVIAGRTGSSYTAELGVMKITEEMDAMRIMGFDPQRFLVLPRIIALMITLPLLIFFADIIGIFGGMFIAHLHMHLSYAEFLHRLQIVLHIKNLWIGILKGPFFAWLIATTGCFYGFRVSSNTESIGRYTTISVVNAIFLVIACDALFSVILTALGL